MLYIFSGHRFWTHRHLDSLLRKAREKGRVVERFVAESEMPLSKYLSQDLFDQKLCVWSEDLFVHEEREAELKDVVPALVSSPDIFIFLEEEISASWKKFFEKYEAKVGEIKSPSEAKLLAWAAGEAKKMGANLSKQQLELIIEEAGGDPWVISAQLLRQSIDKKGEVTRAAATKEPNYFDFADAASKRDRALAVRLLHRYVKEGFGAEEPFWKLWWKIKTLRMVEAGLNAVDAGVHPFVAKKAGEDLFCWKKGELRRYSHLLQDLFSEVRRGEKDFEEGLLPLLLR